ncbi:MAG: FecR domain-containing protein [Bacteroidetes bacterium]|nr:FecR domain-containing protein [Bacteroidota bacterium]MCY4206070.1 FecR domain-containing protein [Bacteroidota bacterium]
MRTDPNPSLPDSILDHLDFSEIPDTQRVWELSAGYYSSEPSTEEFEQISKDMWPSIEHATRSQRGIWAPLTRVIPLKNAPLRDVVTWRGVAALAACIALILSVGITLTQQPTSVFAPFGEQITHELPDGSTVVLNSGTRIKYSKSFGDSARQLDLHEGEVYLNVEHGTIPFVVKSFDAETKVLGTSFNVRSWPDEINAATDVTVESGKVQVIPAGASDLAVTLTAGQSAKTQPNNQKPLVEEAPETSSENLTWINGAFKFSEQSIGNIAKEIERRYNVEIEFSSPELASVLVGVLKESPESAEEIISDICELNCNYRVTQDGFLLTPR